MKVFLALTAFIVAVSATSRINGENGWYVPNVDGTNQWMSREEYQARSQSLENVVGRLLPNDVKFYLYTRANPNKGFEITPTKVSLSASPFKPSNPVKFTIHGWTRDYTDVINVVSRKAWFTHGDFNIIAVDWPRARSKDYLSSVLAIPDTGKKVAAMIDFLKQNYGIPLSKFEVIGHSLGAHVSGYTGKNVSGGKIHKIVALDPALPLFSYDQPDSRINSNDALYVESIQTNGGQSGFLKPIGKATFYPNGGEIQPGCTSDFMDGCSHARSVLYYAEAIEKNNFPAIKCTTYEDAVKHKCGSTYSSIRMAALSNEVSAVGNFYVRVKSTSPFGMS